MDNGAEVKRVNPNSFRSMVPVLVLLALMATNCRPKPGTMVVELNRTHVRVGILSKHTPRVV